MKRSKLIFVIVSIVFFLIMIFFVFDFARRTRFPGHHDSPGMTRTSGVSNHGDSLKDKN